MVSSSLNRESCQLEGRMNPVARILLHLPLVTVMQGGFLAQERAEGWLPLDHSPVG